MCVVCGNLCVWGSVGTRAQCERVRDCMCARVIRTTCGLGMCASSSRRQPVQSQALHALQYLHKKHCLGVFVSVLPNIHYFVLLFCFLFFFSFLFIRLGLFVLVDLAFGLKKAKLTHAHDFHYTGSRHGAGKRRRVE